MQLHWVIVMFDESAVREKLKQFGPPDIYFMKKRWREWIKSARLENFQIIEQRPNVQEVYRLFDETKILSIEPSRYGRYKARLEYHGSLDLIIIFRIADERIELYTYYPTKKLQT